MDSSAGRSRTVREYVAYLCLGFAVHLKVEEFAGLWVVLDLEITGSAIEDENEFLFPVFIKTPAKIVGVDDLFIVYHQANVLTLVF